MEGGVVALILLLIKATMTTKRLDTATFLGNLVERY
jgi:hypothetical protein